MQKGGHRIAAEVAALPQMTEEIPHNSTEQEHEEEMMQVDEQVEEKPENIEEEEELEEAAKENGAEGDEIMDEKKLIEKEKN